MDYPYFSSTNFSAYLGIVILTLLCVYDFRKNTIKPDVMLVYWGALLFFVFINSVVYVGLLTIIAGVKLNFTKLYFYFSGTSAEGFQFESRSLSPILISLLYFGTGSAKFKFNLIASL